jgi:hypothetical protein
LILGGTSSGTPIARTEVFDPSIGNFVSNLDPRFDLMRARSGHRTMAMPDGSLIVVGGVDGAGGVLTVEQVSPITGFSPAAAIPPGGPVVDFAIVPLPIAPNASPGDDRRVGLIIGGRASTDGVALRTMYLINLSTSGGQISINPAGDMLAVGRLNPQVTVMCDGTVLISGGTTEDSVIERYNPTNPKPTN